jgi:hypothetical protein
MFEWAKLHLLMYWCRPVRCAPWLVVCLQGVASVCLSCAACLGWLCAFKGLLQCASRALRALAGCVPSRGCFSVPLVRCAPWLVVCLQGVASVCLSCVACLTWLGACKGLLPGVGLRISQSAVDADCRGLELRLLGRCVNEMNSTEISPFGSSQICTLLAHRCCRSLRPIGQKNGAAGFVFRSAYAPFLFLFSPNDAPVPACGVCFITVLGP